MAQTKACVRHASQQLGLDLSQCKTWIKFLEVHYQREPDHGQAGSMETIEVHQGLHCVESFCSVVMITAVTWLISPLP